VTGAAVGIARRPPLSAAGVPATLWSLHARRRPCRVGTATAPSLTV